VPELDASDSREAIIKLSALAARHLGLDGDEIAAAVLERETILGSGLGHGLAVPQARLPSLKNATVTVALTPQGVAFDGVDPEPVRVIFLVLTPASEPETQLQILAAVARIAREPRLMREITSARTPTALLAALRVADAEAKPA
jgi:PTS system nitrogen regulatory IIA component